MLNDLAAEAQKYGLKINWVKTKIMTNAASAHKTLVSRGVGVDILQGPQGERYLGRRIPAHEYHIAELDHRLSCG